jgi:hypothetical protein
MRDNDVRHELAHQRSPHPLSDVITYPLMRELFALTKSSVAVAIDRQNFVVDFEPKQI